MPLGDTTLTTKFPRSNSYDIKVYDIAIRTPTCHSRQSTHFRAIVSLLCRARARFQISRI